MFRKFPIWILVIPVALLFMVQQPEAGHTGKLTISANLQSDMVTIWPLNQPAVDLPPQLRQHNWMGATGGSCGYASLINVMRSARLYKEADQVHATHGGGSWPSSIAQACKEQNVPYVMTDDGDERLIQWALKTRRAFGIERPMGHVVAGIGLENGKVIILDDNHPQSYDYVPWDEFWSDFHRDGGWSFATTDAPPPPKPRPSNATISKGV